ncbi:MAG: 50S ribosomal protein L22 [Candidatus Zixiibacteriota bacterium]|nr:MAG: 50S ribosomal protein L22 [candidate division Zixibacteria bacterium]
MLVKATAQLRYVSIPPKKMRLVADIVKGLPVEKALGILNFTPRIAAHHLAKTLKSAAANALSKEGTDHLSPENLMIKNITVDAAPTAKRIRFRSMGRVYRYRKRFCHLKVELEGETDIPERKKTPAARTPVKEKAADAKDTRRKTPAKRRTAKTKTVKSKAKTTGKSTKKTAPKKKAAPKARKKKADEK